MLRIGLAGLLLALTACAVPGPGSDRGYRGGAALSPAERAEIGAIRSNDRLDELQKRRLIGRVLAGG